MTTEHDKPRDGHPSTVALLVCGIGGSFAADYLLADQGEWVAVAFWSLLALLGSAIMVYKRASEPGPTAVVACLVAAIALGSATWTGTEWVIPDRFELYVLLTMVAIAGWSIVMAKVTGHAYAQVVVPCAVLLGSLAFVDVATISWQHILMYAVSALAGIAVLVVSCNPAGPVWKGLDQEDREGALLLGAGLIAAGPLGWRIFRFEDIGSDAIDAALIALVAASVLAGLVAALRLRARGGFPFLCFGMAACCALLWTMGPQHYATASAVLVLAGLLAWMTWEWLEQVLEPTGLIGPAYTPPSKESADAVEH